MLVIPDSVKTIGRYAFNGCNGLTSLSIGNSVTSIGNSAFYYCSGMVGTLTIPQTVKSIESSAFYYCLGFTSLVFNADSCTTGSFFGCSNVSSLTFGNNVKIIPAYAFSELSHITGTLTLPNSLIFIGESAFRNCSGLTGPIIIPDSVQTIGDYAFQNCSGLTLLTIGKAVSTIGNCAFQNCSALASVAFNADSCVSMGNYGNVFSNCTNAFTLSIGENVKTIPVSAFKNITSLTGAIVIPDSVKTIGETAFSGCSEITSLTIGKAVSTIGGWAFNNCSALASVAFNADSCISMGDQGRVFLGCSNAATLSIGDNVKTIPGNAFSNFTGLTGSIIIPDSVKTIGNYAFLGCSGITSLTIGKSVSTIGTNAFRNCSALASVAFNADSCAFMGNYGNVFSNCTNAVTLSIGENVKTIPGYAFSNFTGLTGSIIIPDSVKTIGENAFSGCTNIDTLIIGNVVLSIGQSAFSGCSGLTGVLYIPNSVTTIGQSAFYNCSSLTGLLNIPNSVTNIGRNAFNGCSGVDSLIIGEGVVSIGTDAFKNCSSLISVVFNADSCISVGQYTYDRVFNGCTSFSVLTIGKHVKIIPERLFTGCSSLSTVYFNADSCTIADGVFTGTGLTSLSIGENVKHIPSFIFSECNGLTGSLTIPDSVIVIGDYAFYGCTGFSGTLFIPGSVTTIGRVAFGNCSDLTELILGNNVDSIGYSAFSNCTGLSSITSYNEIPPAFVGLNYGHPFYNVNRNTPVYVPCGSAQAYRNVWRQQTNSNSYFYNIYDSIQPYFLITSSEDTLKGTVQITMQPTCTESPVIEATPNFFYVFDHWSDGNTNNPRTVELTQDTTLVAHFREYTITLASSDSLVGIATTVVAPTVDNQQATVEAVVTDSCYVFAGWSNGSTDNPLTISVSQDTTLTATFNSVVNLQITAPSTVCHGDSVTFATTGTDSYLWFNGDTTSVISLLPENSLEVSVTGTNSDGCSASATHFVNVLPRPELVISGMTDICEGESAILTATSSNPTEELLLFEDFEEGIDGWYTMDFDGDGYNWYSTVGNNNQNGYESYGAAASASYINGEGALSPNNMLYTSVHIPITGAQLSWYAAAQDPNWPAEHYEVRVYTQSMGYVGWSSTSIFSETLTDGEWRHHTVDLNDWAGEDILIGFVHANCSDQYVLKIDNVRIVTVISDTYVWSNGHADNQLSVNNAGSYYVTATKPNGCTSSDSVTITVWQPDTMDITINSPENYYVINDETFCTSGDYTQTLHNIHGCDSVINLHLTLAPRDTVFITDTVCGGWHDIYWNGSGYDTVYSVFFGYDYDESIYNIAGYGGWGEPFVGSDGSSGFYVSGEYYRNDSLWIQYDETRTLQAVSGCDSVVKKHHYVKFSDWYSLRDTACGSYVWQGDTLVANPNNLNRWLYAESVNVQGCDSIVELQLTLLPAIEESVTITACDSYIWNGTTYTESGVYTYNTDTTLQETPACKLTTLHLTINHSVTNTFEVTACDSYTWNDSIYTTSGEYTQTFTAANGCDSVVTLHLTVNYSNSGDTTAVACDSFDWYEHIGITASGEYTHTFTNTSGCDSVVTLHLTVNTSDHTDLTATACGEYIWLDSTYTASGNYSITYTNAMGCDSVITLHLTINPIPEVAITGNTTICPGGSTVLTATGADSYMWSNGSSNPSIPVNMFGQYSVIGTSSAGCFSTASVTVLVSQPPVITVSGNTDICAGESTTLTANGGVSYMWSNGSTADTLVATTAGTWQVIGYNEDGCSNMASVTVNVWQPATSNLYITSFDSCYMWFGAPRCESGDYTHTLQTIHGCDSVITLHLTLEDAITNEFSATGCGSYTWNNITYQQSGNYTQTFTAVNGNDSVVTLHLTILEPVSNEFSDTACEVYVWNGTSYTISGNYTQTFTAANGCDSTVTLHLTVNSASSSDFTETACVSFEWNGQTFTTSGDYTQTFIAANGCDSVVTLHLTINQPTTGVDVQTVCDSFMWIDGVTYTESNSTATYTLTNAAGCDSVVTLNLTLNHAETTEFAETACESFEWNGEMFTTSGDYTMTFTNVASCDSVVILHLTVYPAEESEFTITTPDSCYEWNAQTYCTSGTYTQTLQTVHGCDSIVTLHLTITVGIDDYNLGASMTVYPNPTTSVVNVQCTMNNGQAGEVEFQLFDAFGRLLRSTDGVETQNFASLQTARIDLSHYAAGVYFVKAVADGNVVAVRKVVKR